MLQSEVRHFQKWSGACHFRPSFLHREYAKCTLSEMQSNRSRGIFSPGTQGHISETRASCRLLVLSPVTITEETSPSKIASRCRNLLPTTRGWNSSRLLLSTNLMTGKKAILKPTRASAVIRLRGKRDFIYASLPRGPWTPRC